MTTLASRLLLKLPPSQTPLLSLSAKRYAPRISNILHLNQKVYNSYGNSDEYGLLGPLPETRKLPRNTVSILRFNSLAIVIPFIERIKYVKSLKEICLNIPTQSAITQGLTIYQIYVKLREHLVYSQSDLYPDNVTLELDGVLYIKVVDPYKASYGVEDAEYAIAQLAQTTMRAEIGQMTLDRTLAERSHLNANIVDAINSASDAWGVRCLRYEIRDIKPPEKVVQSMHSQ
ncbi:32883_t:CDS:2, partial [Gigaspora margarita]